jgi:hypothetical protein
LDDDSTNPNLNNFRARWTETFSNPLSWEEFSTQCDLFASETRQLATALNHRPTHPTNATTQQPHHPRASRPTNSFNPAEARRIQGMYRHSKKHAARKILATNSISYSGTKDDALTFFTNVFAARPCDTTHLSQHLKDSVPSIDDDSGHLASKLTPTEIQAKLRSAANTSPGPDRVEYRHLKQVDPQCKILALVFNCCMSESDVPKAWKDACTILIHKKTRSLRPSKLSTNRPHVLYL